MRRVRNNNNEKHAVTDIYSLSIMSIRHAITPEQFPRVLVAIPSFSATSQGLVRIDTAERRAAEYHTVSYSRSDSRHRHHARRTYDQRQGTYDTCVVRRPAII
jgi:hypothetical protein